MCPMLRTASQGKRHMQILYNQERRYQMKKFKKWVAKLLRNWAYKLDPVLEYGTEIPRSIHYKQFRIERFSVAHICSDGGRAFCPTEIIYGLSNMITKGLMERGAIRFSEERDHYGCTKYIATVYVRTDWAEEGDVS